MRQNHDWRIDIHRALGRREHLCRSRRSLHADSAHGTLAATKRTSSAVRDFGKQMVHDHHNLRVQGEALAGRMKVTPTLPSTITWARTRKEPRTR
ncbi:MAG: DUF4142 domain-containing protein [Gammaproteobacteria bacterium]